MRRIWRHLWLVPLAAGFLYGVPASGDGVSKQPPPLHPEVEERLKRQEALIEALRRRVEELEKRNQTPARTDAPTRPDPAPPTAAPAGPGTPTPDSGAARARESLLPSRPAQLFGLLQTQFETAEGGKSRFFERRIRLGVRGALEREWGYEVQFELTGDGTPLRNAWIDYVGWKGDAAPVVRAGQVKLPYSLEGWEAAQILPVVERSFVVEQLAVTHLRDSGLALISRSKPRSWWGYQLALTNGAGQNQFIPSRGELFSGRIVLQTPPQRSGSPGRGSIGFSTRQGQVTNRSLPAGNRQEGERYGLEADWRSTLWHLRGEYLWGRNGRQAPRGYYALATYRLTEPTELVARWDVFAPDSNQTEARRTTLGLVHHFSSRVTGVAGYEFVNGSAPEPYQSLFRFRLQATFP